MKFPAEKLLADSEVQNFISQSDFASAADFLFKSQLKNWELMSKNYEALYSTQTKSFWFDGFKIKIQFNPGRIKSTSAPVDEQSIKNRDCFLCIKNLPESQKGILIANKFFLLCNPYPILPWHFTIASLQHKPQRILKYFNEFLTLSKLLSTKYTMIYNGPSCGASAPDHLHFQAVTRQLLPIENDIQQMKNEYRKVVYDKESTSISFIDDRMRKIILLESKNKLQVEKFFGKIYKVYEDVVDDQSEPMMNLLSNYNEEFGWKLILFLRSKHRPVCFFSKGKDKLMVSPAAVDLGGLVITPRKEDFEKIDRQLIQKIINEVSLDPKTFALIENSLKQT